MTYIKQTWTDENLIGDPRYDIHNDDGTPINENVRIGLSNDVETAGTPLTAERMNHIEGGVETASNEIAVLSDDVETINNTIEELYNDSGNLNVGDPARLIVGTNGEIKLPYYGAGTFGGSASKMLGVSSNGNIVESDGGDFIPLDGWIPVSETWTFGSADAPEFVIYVSGNVAANANYALGLKTRCTNNSAAFYGYITKIGAYDSGNDLTPITVYGGSDYTLVSGAITERAISRILRPVGFPSSRAVWDIRVVSTDAIIKNSPTTDVFYGQTNLMNSSETLPSINVPAGLWSLSMIANVNIARASANDLSLTTTLSTLGDEASSNELTFRMNSYGTSAAFTAVVSKNNVAAAAKTTYYFLMATSSGASSIRQHGSGSFITAKFEYY